MANNANIGGIQNATNMVNNANISNLQNGANLSNLTNTANGNLPLNGNNLDVKGAMNMDPTGLANQTNLNGLANQANVSGLANQANLNSLANGGVQSGLNGANNIHNTATNLSFTSPTNVPGSVISSNE